MQEFEFVDNRRGLRAIGILLLALCLLAAYVIFFGAWRGPDTGRSDIRLPKIGALPAANAPKTRVSIDRDREVNHDPREAQP